MSVGAQAAANVDWWKLREAALLAVGSVADNLVSSSSHVEPDCFQVHSLWEHMHTVQAVASSLQPAALQVSGFLENILQEDLGKEGVPMFLQGRALWVAAK